MSVSFNKFNSFVDALSDKTHSLGSDALTIALCAAANAPVATNTVLANLTQIAYTYCSTRVITIASHAQTSGTLKLIGNDLVLTATGGAIGPFRYVVIYNDTATSKELIGWYDYGSEITLAAGETLTIDFDNVNGILTLA